MSKKSTLKPVLSHARVRNVVEALRASLHIYKMSDWYNVKMHMLPDYKNLMQKYDSMEALLRSAYPEHDWLHENFSIKHTRHRQLLFERAVCHMFRGHSFEKNNRSELRLENGRIYEIDLYSSDLKLGFEFQEEHHYRDSHFGGKPLYEVQNRDREKAKLAEQMNIGLVIVPFWWDRTIYSLICEVLHVRPDLVFSSFVVEETTEDLESFALTPQDPPDHVAKMLDRSIPGFGEVQQAIHLHLLSDVANLKFWTVMEKFDGVRGIWQPSEGRMYSRNGKILLLPKFIGAAMSDIFMDGEIWFGRQSLEKAFMISSKVSFDQIPWDEFRYVLFDIPMNDPLLGLRRRLQTSHEISPAAHPFIIVPNQKICTSEEGLKDTFESLIAVNAEGIMLRRTDSLYGSGASRQYLKYKGFRDAEAKVLKKIGPTEFRVMIINQEDKETPLTMRSGETSQPLNINVDDIVTYKFSRWQNGMPLNALITHLRKDVDWATVKSKQVQPEYSGRMYSLWKPKKVVKSWRDPAVCKKFLDDFAASQNFDPTNVTLWRKVKTEEFGRKGGIALMNKYGGLRAAVRKIYGFDLKSNQRWTQKSMRDFMDNVARTNNFDPMDWHAWMRFPVSEIQKMGGASFIKYHGGREKAIAAIYGLKRPP